MPILHFGYLTVSILFSKSGEICIAAAAVSILSFEITQHPGRTASQIKNLASVQAAAADQRENKAGLPYRLWRFAAIHHCRGSFPKIIHSSPFIFRSLFIHELGNDVSPRSLFFPFPPISLPWQAVPVNPFRPMQRHIQSNKAGIRKRLKGIPYRPPSDIYRHK
jgi:hypothetical protein